MIIKNNHIDGAFVASIQSIGCALTNFLSDEEYEASWDALFEEYQREIRDDLEKTLGVEHSRYWGMLD